MEDLDAMIEGLDRLDSVVSIEDLRFKQGQLEILKRIRNMATTMEAAYEDLNNEEAQANPQ